ncbi:MULTISPECIES: hypothetical protein [Bacillus]|uniref:hypothetical protein n=1 Tax=Bacillus TaxID=1386 RepID=UPI00030B2E94|nr:MULTISPECIES: hypothetical protein [Bacillus]
MSRNIVVGALRFFGFHICNFLLEKGQRVAGIEWDMKSVEHQEAKEMFIGRNANFSLLTENHSFLIEEDDNIYISIYDYLLEEDRSCFLFFLETLNRFTPSSFQIQCKVYIFIPRNLPEEYNDQIESWKNALPPNASYQWIYISDLYGPWISTTSNIQKNMLGEQHEIDMSHSIYIDDFLSHLEAIQQSGSLIVNVEPKYNEGWRKDYAEFFKVEATVESSKQNDDDAFIVTTNTTLIKGLQQLAKHNDKIKFLDQWK